MALLVQAHLGKAMAQLMAEAEMRGAKLGAEEEEVESSLENAPEEDHEEDMATSMIAKVCYLSSPTVVTPCCLSLFPNSRHSMLLAFFLMFSQCVSCPSVCAIMRRLCAKAL